MRLRTAIYKLAISKIKYTVKVLYELAILLTHFMKEYSNLFDTIQFCHTFLSIFRNI